MAQERDDRPQIDIAPLVAAAQGLLARPGRQVLAIAGPPGSGKSRLAQRLAAQLDDPPGRVAILPMDGFHYDDAVLHQMGRRPWKGAPDTFDLGGLGAMLARLRDPAEGAVAVPVFDRDLEISRGSARIIGPEARLIVIEGNYLLLDRPGWDRLRAGFDLTAMIEVPEDELHRRLLRRWQRHGLDEAEIAFKLQENDLPNGRVVAHESRPADLVLRF
ncbi:nucleoside/nucleotide kinase family protein [Paracoccus limosus]|uniref:Nucleoside/nucleotide kinase family protein n=1 Tax=Paracoccus limosus TaxID=913252 RepID=A0A844H2U8_9RHOB|nr:nucleoside/nucleotide kinase family protein [Paracoccus limosus]MTH35249.1 nucleoside/nucleotide kinase family protein [Paracoccus limosus]